MFLMRKFKHEWSFHLFGIFTAKTNNILPGYLPLCTYQNWTKAKPELSIFSDFKIGETNINRKCFISLEHEF